MTILHLIQKPQFRGAEIFTSQLATHTRNDGHKVLIICLYPGEVQLPFDGKIMNLGGRIHKRFWDVKAWRKLAQIITKEQPDIIQANAGDTLKYAVFSKWIYRWKQPIIFRNASTISLYIKKRVVKILNGYFFRYADKIVSVSHASANDFVTVFPECKNKIVVVPVGVEETIINPKEITDKKINNAYYPQLLHVGGFTYEKNHNRLIEIFSKLLKTYPNAFLHLVGDGPLKKNVEEIVQYKGLNNRVRFYGARRDAMQLISQPDALLLPSIIEGLPGVILEAFYHRIPVVAYDVGGVREILIKNETGYLVNKGDENGFVKAICELMENQDKMHQIVNKAYQLVNHSYLNKKIAKDFIKVYESVIGRQEDVIIRDKFINHA